MAHPIALAALAIAATMAVSRVGLPWHLRLRSFSIVAPSRNHENRPKNVK